jgi:hypothetical protein
VLLQMAELETELADQESPCCSPGPFEGAEQGAETRCGHEDHLPHASPQQLGMSASEAGTAGTPGSAMSLDEPTTTICTGANTPQPSGRPPPSEQYAVPSTAIIAAAAAAAAAAEEEEAQSPGGSPTDASPMRQRSIATAEESSPLASVSGRSCRSIMSTFSFDSGSDVSPEEVLDEEENHDPDSPHGRLTVYTHGRPSAAFLRAGISASLPSTSRRAGGGAGAGAKPLAAAAVLSSRVSRILHPMDVPMLSSPSPAVQDTAGDTMQRKVRVQTRALLTDSSNTMEQQQQAMKNG